MGNVIALSKNAAASAANPMDKSAVMQMIFRLYLSAATPAKGLRNAIGRYAANPATPIIIGEAVCSANHQIKANWTAELPIKEMACPIAMVRNLPRHFVLFSIFVLLYFRYTIANLIWEQKKITLILELSVIKTNGVCKERYVRPHCLVR